jgi:peptidyl-prolyl cis-trans isomerase A (cyclophilin A)
MHTFKLFSKFVIVAILALSSSYTLAANPQLLFQTNRGEFLVELYPEKAPKTVANILSYVNAGFYENTIFHRVISNFMIQGGGFTIDMIEKETNAPIVNESNNGLVNDIGTLAMARTNDPNSATSQFFINLKHNQFLDYQLPNARMIGYCVFGKVLTGMDVVREIGITPTTTKSGMGDVPTSPIIINKVKVMN